MNDDYDLFGIKKELERADYLISKYGFKRALILSVATKLLFVLALGLFITSVCCMLFNILGIPV